MYWLYSHKDKACFSSKDIVKKKKKNFGWFKFSIKKKVQIRLIFKKVRHRPLYS